ncbi:MAG TPA: hypothetical protein VFH87_05520 [Candidatus Udaeobacter sp.]|nr:hypothetical protein [Candidatus Udaeobacter sp.]
MASLMLLTASLHRGRELLLEEIAMCKQFATFLIAALACGTLSAQEFSPTRLHQPTLTPQNSGTTNGLIAVWPVNPRVVWASGRAGTFTVTTDGGQTWRAGVVPGAEALQFRDVQAFSANVAYLMSIGTSGDPTEFRIYKTEDAGATWTIQFENQNLNAFYDGFAFWTPHRGIAHSDSVNGVFPDLRTTDGTTWQDISNNMPAALPGETSFASSGTCVTTQGGRNAWICTGGSAISRVLATRDAGNTWNAYNTPLISSPSAGAFTVDFRNPFHGIVGGGDLDPNDPNNARTATSSDGGQTWTLTNPPPVTGAIFGLSYVGRGGGDNDGNDSERNNRGSAVVITANDGGAAWTPDEGTTWFALPDVTGFWAVAFATPKAGWLVGTDGRILKISF